MIYLGRVIAFPMYLALGSETPTCQEMHDIGRPEIECLLRLRHDDGSFLLLRTPNLVLHKGGQIGGECVQTRVSPTVE